MAAKPAPAAPEISGFVLAGGRSSRLGRDKVLLPWKGRTLLDHAVARLRKVCGSVRVCADRDDLGSSIPDGGPVIRDALAGAGPLAGMVAALEQSQTQWNFFLAVDMPLVPAELLQVLAARAGSGYAEVDGRLAILPEVDEMPQPLCGLFYRSLADGLRDALEEGKYKIVLALGAAVVRIESGTVDRGRPEMKRPFPPMGTSASRIELFDVRAFAENTMANSLVECGDWFLNINTPEDWERAKQLSSL